MFLAARGGAGAGSRHLPERPPPAATFRVVARRVVTPDPAEVLENPRARSAKMRAAERTDAPARTAPDAVLPRLPSLAEVLRGDKR